MLFLMQNETSKIVEGTDLNYSHKVYSFNHWYDLHTTKLDGSKTTLGMYSEQKEVKAIMENVRNELLKGKTVFEIPSSTYK